MLKSESFLLRKMTLNDYDMVVELWLNIDGMGLRSLDDPKEGINAFLKRNPNTCFVALDSKKIIGPILCGHYGRRGYIYHTAVCSEYRKQGIGTALTAAATNALRNEGITRVCLNVMDSNESGKLFWMNQGWEKKDFLGFYSKSITDKDL